MKKLIKKYWPHVLTMVGIILLLSTIFGPYNPPDNLPIKKDKAEVDSLKARLVRMAIENQIIADRFNQLSSNEKKKTDSLITIKKITDKELQQANNEATLWAWRYALLINDKDTAGAIIACDSVIQINKDLIAVNEHMGILYDSTVAGYDRQLSVKDLLINEQVDYGVKVRQSFDELKGRYDELYGYQNKLRKRIMFGKVKQKVLAAAALAGVTYFLVDNIK